MSRVFISYRRADTAWQARALYERMSQHFDVFMDVDGTVTGTSFVRTINVALRTTKVVLVLIGPDWLVQGARGTARLFDLNDHVRREIEMALAGEPDILTIPVLVDDATMPLHKDVPETLYPLLGLQALHLQPAHWQSTIDEIIKSIDSQGVARLVHAANDPAAADTAPPARVEGAPSDGDQATDVDEPVVVEPQEPKVQARWRARARIASMVAAALVAGFGLATLRSALGILPPADAPVPTPAQQAIIAAPSPPVTASVAVTRAPVDPPDVAATVAPTRPGSVLLADEFFSPETGKLPRVSPDSSNFSAGYADGEYVIKKLNPAWQFSPTVPLPGSYTDSSIAVSARVIGDPTGREIALGCRHENIPGNVRYYRLSIKTDSQEYRIHVWDGQNATELAHKDGWLKALEIRPGEGWNRYELSCIKNVISAKINGVAMKPVSDERFSSGGLFIGSGQPQLLSEVRFDDLIVSQR